MGTALLVIQGIGILEPIAMDLAMAIKKLLEPTSQVVVIPVLQNWNTDK